MARSLDGRRRSLIELRAVDAAYPLYGAVVLDEVYRARFPRTLTDTLSLTLPRKRGREGWGRGHRDLSELGIGWHEPGRPARDGLLGAG